MKKMYCDLCGKEIPERGNDLMPGADLCGECEMALRQISSGIGVKRLKGFVTLFKTMPVESIKTASQGYVVSIERSEDFFEIFGADCDFKPVAGGSSGYAIHIEEDVTYETFCFKDKYDKAHNE